MTDSEKLAFLIRYNCPVWMDGYDEHAKRQRYLLKTRSWTFAQARLIEVEQGHIPAPRPTAQTPSVETAIASYLDDCRARRLQPSTITSYTKTLEHLSAFFAEASLADITLARLTVFRSLRMEKVGRLWG